MPRGRKPGFRLTDEHRAKIKNSNVLNALIEHVEGKREMSSTQVTAGLGLLKKVLPDLLAASIENSAEAEATMPTEILLAAKEAEDKAGDAKGNGKGYH